MSTGSELQTKGIRLFESGKYAEAAEVFTEAVKAYQDEDHADLAAEMRVNLGLAKRELGEHESAIEEMQTSLAFFQGQGNLLREAQTRGNMALVYAKLDDHEQAETMYRHAANIFRELGENDLYGETILALGDMLFRSGNLMGAVGTYEAGLAHISDKNHRQKIMKQLLILKNRITGEQRQAESSDGEPTSDRRRRRRGRNS